MSTVDVRCMDASKVTRIVYAEGCHLEQQDKNVIRVMDEDSDYINVFADDVDNLIIALQKAKELWWT